MSEQNAIRIVVDTNIWISFLIGRSLDSLVNDIKTKNVEIYFSRELHNELYTVMNRPKFKSQITEDKIAEIREIVNNMVRTINPKSRITDCRDPKDNFLLELAVDATADFLLTGDSDLLDLNPFRNVRIIRIPEFERILKNR